MRELYVMVFGAQSSLSSCSCKMEEPSRPQQCLPRGQGLRAEADAQLQVRLHRWIMGEGKELLAV